MKINVAKEVAVLEAMSVGELRAKYAQVFGEETRVGNKAWLIKRIVEDYVDGEIRVAREIKEAIDEYEAGDLELIPHEVVMAEMDQFLRKKWGDAEFERLTREAEEERKAWESARPKQKRRA